MSNDNLKKALIEQQDLYGAPPIDIEPVDLKDAPIQALYGVPSPIKNEVLTQKLYGPPSYFEENNNTGKDYRNIKTAVNGTGIAFSIIIFIIGLIAMFNKKLSKTAKLILCISLAAVLVAIILIVVVTNIVL